MLRFDHIQVGTETANPATRGFCKGRIMGMPKERHQQTEIELLRTRLRSLRRAVDETEDLLNRYINAEQALRESEERFRLLVAAVKDYAIFMLDIHGNILSWNAGAQRIKGYT